MTLNSIHGHRSAVPTRARQTSEEALPEDINADDARTGGISTREVVLDDALDDARDDDALDDARDGDALGGDAMDDPVRPALVASVEPSVVFASLAAQCVLQLCDDCIIDLVDGGRSCYRIVYPPPHATGGGLLRLADRAGAAPDHRIRVRFTRSAAEQVPFDESRDTRGEAGEGEFHGVATFVWHRRTPTRADRTAAAVLIDHAVHLVVWQRSEHRASTVTAHAANLELALQSSRHIGTAIGILMSLHKITQDRAFDLLRTASQHSHRKLRDLALEVIDTGWLDPALLPVPPRPSQLNGRPGGSETNGTWYG